MSWLYNAGPEPTTGLDVIEVHGQGPCPFPRCRWVSETREQTHVHLFDRHAESASAAFKGLLTVG